MVLTAVGLAGAVALAAPGGGQGARAWSIVHPHRLSCRALAPKARSRARAKRARPCRSAPQHRAGRCHGCFWRGDFSADNWSQYNGSPAYHPDGDPADYAIVNKPTPPGFAHAFEATTASGTSSIVSGQDGERTLLTLWPDDGNGSAGLTHAYQGTSTWYRDEIYFPAGFRPSKESDFSWVYELHNYPDNEGDAMLMCGVDTDNNAYGPFSDGGGVDRHASPERFSCRIFGGGSPTYPFNGYNSTNWYKNPAVKYRYMIGLRSVPTGQWLDMVWHINWDWRSTASGGRGGMQWWINGRQVGSYTGPTLLYLTNAPGDRGAGGANQAYLQDGYYRPTDADAGYAQPTASVYHGATMIGPTAASIGESVQ